MVNPDRQKVINAFAPALSLQGNAAHGGELFAKTCTACHLLNGQGHAVGPDLASVGDKSPEGLLVAILDPNRAVEPQYVNYVAQTKDGQTVSGVVGRETGSSVTLKVPGGQEQTVLRTDLESFRSTGLSLMPEGLEAGLSPPDLADLIAFVRGSAPEPKRRAVRRQPPGGGAALRRRRPAADAGDRRNLRQPGRAGKAVRQPRLLVRRRRPRGLGVPAGPGRALRRDDRLRLRRRQCRQHAGDPGRRRALTFHVESSGNWDTYRRKGHRPASRSPPAGPT